MPTDQWDLSISSWIVPSLVSLDYVKVTIKTVTNEIDTGKWEKPKIYTNNIYLWIKRRTWLLQGIVEGKECTVDTRESTTRGIWKSPYWTGPGEERGRANKEEREGSQKGKEAKRGAERENQETKLLKWQLYIRIALYRKQSQWAGEV